MIDEKKKKKQPQTWLLGAQHGFGGKKKIKNSERKHTFIQDGQNSTGGGGVGECQGGGTLSSGRRHVPFCSCAIIEEKSRVGGAANERFDISGCVLHLRVSCFCVIKGLISLSREI